MTHSRHRWLKPLLLIAGVCLIGFSVGCQTTRGGAKPATPANNSHALFVNRQIGHVERVMDNGRLVVISVRQGVNRHSLQAGTRLETRSLQYNHTGVLELGPNPSTRYFSAHIVEGTPEVGDLVMYAQGNRE